MKYVNKLIGPVAPQDKTENESTLHVYHNLNFDMNHIMEIFHPIFGQYYGYQEILSMIYSVNNIFCVLDKVSHQYVACALVNLTREGGAYIMLFGVRQLNQSRGTGTLLMESVIQWAVKARCKYVYLHVHVENQKAIGLYLKFGFKKQKYLEKYYGHLPKRPPDAFQMVLPLERPEHRHHLPAVQDHRRIVPDHRRAAV